MRFEVVDINSIHLSSQKDVIPNKKKMRNILKSYIVDSDNLYVVVNYRRQVIFNENNYRFAKFNGLTSINCILLDKSEIFSPELNKVVKRFTATEKVFIRDKAKCYICGMTTSITDDDTSFSYSTKDHLFPQCNGGISSMDNLKCCCKYCNNTKSSRILTPELKKIISSQKRTLVECGITSFKKLNEANNAEVKEYLIKEIKEYDAKCTVTQ